VQSWPETGIHNQDPTGFHFQIRDTPNFLFETGYLVHPLDGHATRSTGSANGKSYPGAYKFGGVYNGGKFSDPAGHMSNSNYLIYGMASQAWLHFRPHWKETESHHFKLLCFCTMPAMRNFVANLISEIIGTLVLVFVVGAIFSKAVAGSGLVVGLGAYLVAALVWGIGLSLGGTTGYAINPARDFGPRLAHALLPIAGKGTSDWGYAIVPVLGPIIGGGLAGMLLRTVVK